MVQGAEGEGRKGWTQGACTQARMGRSHPAGLAPRACCRVEGLFSQRPFTQHGPCPSDQVTAVPLLRPCKGAAGDGRSDTMHTCRSSPGGEVSPATAAHAPLHLPCARVVRVTGVAVLAKAASGWRAVGVVPVGSPVIRATLEGRLGQELGHVLGEAGGAEV